MSNKKIIYIAIALIAIFGIVAGIYLTKEDKLPNGGLNNEIIEENNFTNNGTDQKTEENLLVKDDFSINVPEGWQETAAPQGISAMVVNINEEVTDPAAKRINFKSYFSISYDSSQGRSREEYLEYTKNILEQSIPEIVFTHQEAQAIEAEITQQGVDFKVLIVMVNGVGEEDIWAISFNTTKDKWNEYKDLFYETAGSFLAKL